MPFNTLYDADNGRSILLIAHILCLTAIDSARYARNQHLTRTYHLAKLRYFSLKTAKLTNFFHFSALDG